MTKYYAHSLEGQPLEKWQLLEKHLYNVANLASSFAEEFGAQEWGRVAGLWHDVGKSSKDFQGYLRSENNIQDEFTAYYKKGSKVDHATAGAQYSKTILGNEIGRLLAYCIAGHHAGLANGKDETASSLFARLQKNIPEYCNKPELTSTPSPENLPFSKRVNGFNISFFVRMLFSCLVDADFLDTEKFMNLDKSQSREYNSDLMLLWTKLATHIATFDPESSVINKIRSEILTACLDSADDKPGFYSLTVPTGGGKTISSLAFALKHAIKHGKKRIIYVIPYTSIIEQNAQVFRDILGDDAVLEHHSNFDIEKETTYSELASQNWDAPIVVTTNVQFFESLFANKGSRCRKLHNIANSVVILDEAQMLPVNLLHPCLEAMKSLVEYKVTMVLCTATQPVLTKSDEFKIGLPKVKEIIQNTKDLYESLQRVVVNIKHEPLSDDDLAIRLSNQKQVLCIVSNKRQARSIYNLMSDVDGVYHLSSMMCPEHRTVKLKEIKQRLRDKKACCVISTQLIEAGVDIDFPVVYRAISGIDSIAQAAGRCNREGKLEQGVVNVFQPADSKNIPPGFLRQSSQIGEQVLRHHEADPLSLESTCEYFKRLYWHNSEQLDKYGICNMLDSGMRKLNFPFKNIAEKFTIINSKTRAIIIPFDKNGETICSEIRSTYKYLDRTISQKAQRLTVQIHPIIFDNLRMAGAVEPFLDEKYWILSNPDIYHDAMGLLPDDPGFYKVDTLII
jgi:CRISPR-associated endonuclease/helicase Cas3